MGPGLGAQKMVMSLCHVAFPVRKMTHVVKIGSADELELVELSCGVAMLTIQGTLQ